MIRARIADIAILGLDAENVRRLVEENDPVLIDLAESLKVPGQKPPVKLLIVAGATLADAAARIEEHTGVKLPPPEKWGGVFPPIQREH
jgi:hypothetical protein